MLTYLGCAGFIGLLILFSTQPSQDARFECNDLTESTNR